LIEDYFLALQVKDFKPVSIINKCNTFVDHSHAPNSLVVCVHGIALLGFERDELKAIFNSVKNCWNFSWPNFA